jgi:hypothetical protein
MGDRPGSPSRVCMSEDKVRRKDMCWSVGIYIHEGRRFNVDAHRLASGALGAGVGRHVRV